MRTIPTISAVLAACGGSSFPSARFENAPPVTVVDDRQDVPVPPAKTDTVRALYFFDGTFTDPVVRAMELRPALRARGVNALDEVPDSTWFTNRIGARALTPAQLVAGPTRVGSPEAHRPWTIHSTKVNGESVGFEIEDRRGERFLLKFDRAGFPEVETTADVIVDRLLWACGYHVPEDHIVYFRRGDLEIAPDATARDALGGDRPLTAADLDASLALLEIEPDGEIRGMASRIIDGVLLGGTPGEGVREDDPNDRIPHELRRDLRGALPIYAWLDHVDVKLEASLDTWVADPADPRRHYVMHYQIDFGKTLGAHALLGAELRSGFEYAVDFAELGESFTRLGIEERPWETRGDPYLRGVGLYEARTYDPGTWKPLTPAYVPLLAADRIDYFWGAKILMRFTPEQLHAVVASARLTDPRAADYLTATLVARQRATALHAFTQVNPLDRFKVVSSPQGPRVCFDDLLLTYRLAGAHATTRYEVTSYDRQGRVVGAPTAAGAAPSGHACTAPVAIAGDAHGYTIVRITTRRPGTALSTLVHLAHAPGHATPRVIGIWRE